MLYRLTNFRLIVIKLYYSKNLEDNDTNKAIIPNIIITVTPLTKKRGRGRPKGSKYNRLDLNNLGRINPR
jgi:hypothetical protein